ncbi:MAG: sortase [Candidatus Paceibacterota bacterium]
MTQKFEFRNSKQLRMASITNEARVFVFMNDEYSMETDQIKKIALKITACKKPLIVMPKNPDPDALGASLGLFLALKKLTKDVRLICSSRISKKYEYLAEYDSIMREIEGNSEYCISFDLEDQDIRSVIAENRHGSIRLKISAGHRSIKTDSLKLACNGSDHDLIITVSAPTTKSIGRIYSENKAMFQGLEMININNSPKSESYGVLNICVSEMTVSEMIFAILSEMKLVEADPKISTALLSGIIAGTKNFQKEKIGYQTFETASRLMAGGADRDEVIRYFKRSDIPFYIVECYSQVADSIGRSDGISQAFRKIEEFATKKKLNSAEKAVLLIMVVVFAAQNVKISKNGQGEDVSGDTLFELPKRNIVYAVDKLPITDEILGSIIDSEAMKAGVGIEADAVLEIDNSDISQKIADPRTLKIASLKVNANIQYVGLNDDGSVGVPTSEKEVAWYMFGPRPGEEGNAVIVGHRDSKTNPNGVFRRLNDVKIGDKIEIVDVNGNTLKFNVIKKAAYDDSNAPMKEIFGTGDKRMLNLITCSGAWNAKENNYDNRTVIYSELEE